MVEHRCEPRITLLTPMIVVEPQTGVPIGYVSDVSRHGVMVIVKDQAETEQQMAIRIMLPGGEEPGYIDAAVNTRWCESSLNPDLKCIGCCFVEPEAVDVERLMAIAKRLAVKEDVELHRVAAH